jgi:tetraacyldisaccharide-1-P 4'-kinase
VASSFSRQIIVNKTPLLAVIVPQLRQDGMHYEVNIKGYHRFYMAWSALGRYDVTGDDGGGLPYELVLAVSDVIEAQRKK